MKRLLVIPVLVLAGCAGWQIRPGDSTTVKAAKVVARIPVALASGGMSEMLYGCARDRGGSEADLEACHAAAGATLRAALAQTSGMQRPPEAASVGSPPPLVVREIAAHPE
jgi:hypothetical protein